MAFELIDINRAIIQKGDYRGLFNVARSDEASETTRYYAFFNEAGAYVIQKVAVSGGVGTYTYYVNGDSSTFDANWTARASLSYVEYHNLFAK